MNLSFKVFGYEIWSLDLETPAKPEPARNFHIGSMDTAIKAVSRQWMKGLMR